MTLHAGVVFVTNSANFLKVGFSVLWEDYNSMTTMINEGYFGINIHRSNPYDESYAINKWSAGCQVFKKVEDYNSFIETCKESAKIYGNSFTYTLIEEKDLRKHLDS